MKVYRQVDTHHFDLLPHIHTDFSSLLQLQPTLEVNELYTHWLNGGYPEPRIKSEEFPEFYGLWMDDYFSDYIRRDIQRLFPRINVHKFRLFIQALSHYSGGIINHSKIARALDTSSVTVKEYLTIFHSTFIWRNLPSYEKNSLKKVQKMAKGFFRDQGVLHHLLKIDSVDKLLYTPLQEPLLKLSSSKKLSEGFKALCCLVSTLTIIEHEISLK